MTLKKFVLFFLVVTPFSASAECMVCDTEIVLSPPLAECFVERVEKEIEMMASSGLDFQMVNLSDCAETSKTRSGLVATVDSARSVVSWREIRDATKDTRIELSTVFVLDEPSLRCLAERIKSGPEQFDPAAAFRHVEMCKE